MGRMPSGCCSAGPRPRFCDGAASSLPWHASGPTRWRRPARWSVCWAPSHPWAWVSAPHRRLSCVGWLGTPRSLEHGRRAVPRPRCHRPRRMAGSGPGAGRWGAMACTCCRTGRPLPVGLGRSPVAASAGSRRESATPPALSAPLRCATAGAGRDCSCLQWPPAVSRASASAVFRPRRVEEARPSPPPRARVLALRRLPWHGLPRSPRRARPWSRVARHQAIRARTMHGRAFVAGPRAWSLFPWRAALRARTERPAHWPGG